jgi:hypothetical protein
VKTYCYYVLLSYRFSFFVLKKKIDALQNFNIYRRREAVDQELAAEEHRNLLALR